MPKKTGKKSSEGFWRQFNKGGLLTGVAIKSVYERRQLLRDHRNNCKKINDETQRISVEIDSVNKALERIQSKLKQS